MKGAGAFSFNESFLSLNEVFGLLSCARYSKIVSAKESAASSMEVCARLNSAEVSLVYVRKSIMSFVEFFGAFDFHGCSIISATGLVWSMKMIIRIPF